MLTHLNAGAQKNIVLGPVKGEREKKKRILNHVLYIIRKLTSFGKPFTMQKLKI